MLFSDFYFFFVFYYFVVDAIMNIFLKLRRDNLNYNAVVMEDFYFLLKPVFLTFFRITTIFG